MVILNLQTAYDEENNAAAKYDVYAEKADGAGYKSVAALFRAISRSEHIHAMEFANILKANGIKPKSEVRLPKYVDVISSLRDGLHGESQEMNALFPGFLEEAKARKSPQEIIDLLQRVIKTDTEHAAFYALALNYIEDWKEPGKIFLVCRNCGHIMNRTDIEHCPLCSAEKEQFEVFK